MDIWEIDWGNALNYPCLTCHVPAGMFCRYPPGIIDPFHPKNSHPSREQVAGIQLLMSQGHLADWPEDLILDVLWYDVEDCVKLVVAKSRQTVAEFGWNFAQLFQ